MTSDDFSAFLTSKFGYMYMLKIRKKRTRYVVCFTHSTAKQFDIFFATPCSLNDVNSLKTAKAPAHFVWKKYDALEEI